eukprot:765147-Hanusia_phi.AAC.8
MGTDRRKGRGETERGEGWSRGRGSKRGDVEEKTERGERRYHMLLRLGGDYQVVEDVLRVSEPPVPLLPHLLQYEPSPCSVSTNLLRHLGIGRLDGPGEDLFRGVSCAVRRHEVTLIANRRLHKAIHPTLRICLRKQIPSFPIFAHWENNSLQLRGRFGVTAAAESTARSENSTLTVFSSSRPASSSTARATPTTANQQSSESL